MDPDYLPSWEELSVRRHKARKQHQCNICGGPIRGGTYYYRVVGMLDDVFHSFAQHLHPQDSNTDCLEMTFR